MNIYVGALVIFVTFAAAMLGLGFWLSRTRLGHALPPPADPQPLDQQWYGPFPVDTGPLPLLSELSAGWDALEREQRGWSS